MNAMTQALASLNKCLLNNQSLKPGQFSGAIKQTFNETEADWSRLDYQFLMNLAKVLDEAEANDRRP
jgi:hypothetical protein